MNTCAHTGEKVGDTIKYWEQDFDSYGHWDYRHIFYCADCLTELEFRDGAYVAKEVHEIEELPF